MRIHFMLLSFILVSLSRVGFSLISSECRLAATNFVQLSGSPCTQLLSIFSTGDTSSCTASETDCMDPLAWAERDVARVLPAFRFSDSTTCSLCDIDDETSIATYSSTCKSLMKDIFAPLTYITIPSESDFPSELYYQATMAIAQSCGNANDYQELLLLRYQPDVVCNRVSSLGRNSTDNYIQGAYDARALTQCSTCAVVPCIPGMYCPAGVSPKICASGYYCPTTQQQILCPSGYYCPQGSVQPVKCRPTAAGSCRGDAPRFREFVWVPSFVAGVILLALIAVRILHSLQRVSFLNRLIGSKPSDAPMDECSGEPEEEQEDRQAQAEPQPAQEPSRSVPGFAMTFEDLYLKTGTNVRLTNVSGTVQPGRFTALMGASGAGKTTLMNVLLGREKQTSGQIVYSLGYAPDSSKPARVADVPASCVLPADALRLITGFVPQTDTLCRELTVEQLLRHACLTRRTFSKADHDVSIGLEQGEGVIQQRQPRSVDEAVEETLQRLGLAHVRHCVVGGPGYPSSISPGERKLCSMGVELICGTSCLMLDEPTSNSDSSSAMQVARTIKAVARTGVTCVAVIHQPRGEIFSMIDDLILLRPGGLVAYQGPAHWAHRYFAKFGYVCPLGANFADFILDLVSGLVEKSDQMVREEDEEDDEHELEHEGTPEEESLFEIGEAIEDVEKLKGSASAADTENPLVSSKKDEKEDWAALWTLHGPRFIEEMTAESTARQLKRGSAPSSSRTKKSEATAAEVAALRDRFLQSRPSFLQQVWAFTLRSFLQKAKGNGLLLDMLSILVGGIVIGIVTCMDPLILPPIAPTYRFSCPPGAETLCQMWEAMTVEPATFYLTMTIIGLTLPAFVRSYGHEKETFEREAYAGVSPTAYFLGHLLPDLLQSLLSALFFVAPLALIAPWRAPTELLFLLCACICIFSQGMGYAFSLLIKDPDTATLAGVVVGILLNVFGGFVPLPGPAESRYFSYAFFSARALVAIELMEGFGFDVDTYNDWVVADHRNPQWGSDLGVLLIFAVISTLAALALLHINNKARKL